MTYEAIVTTEIKYKKPIVSPTDVFQLVKSYLEPDRDELVLITMDNKAHVIGTYIVQVGLLNIDNLDVVEMFGRVIKDESYLIAVCFLKPKNERVSPTTKEIHTAQTIAKVCKTLEIRLEFQLLVTKNGFSEFKHDRLN
jgi:DNA repair protein RadC